MKNNFPKQDKLVRKVTLFYIFAKLFNVWFKGRQLGSCNDFCIHSTAILQVGSL